MPNWVINKVKINPKNRGKEILDRIIVVNNEKEELNENDVSFDFNKIIPMPKVLDLTSGGNQEIAVQYYLSKVSEDKIDDLHKQLRERKVAFYDNYLNKMYKRVYKQEEMEKYAKKFKEKIDKGKVDIFDNVDYKSLGINNLEDLGKTYVDNIIKYGCDTWYDWSCKYWGTKWNSARTYRELENEVEFQTAWSCPLPILLELSRQNKDIEILVDYADEDIGSNCGTIRLLNGEVLEHDIKDTDFALDTWGYDKDDYYDEMEECDD